MADKNPVSNGVTSKSPAFTAVVKAVRFDIDEATLDEVLPAFVFDPLISAVFNLADM